MNHFSTLAQKWDDNPNRIKYSEAISAYIRNHIDRDQRLTALEVGAGTGTLSIMLEKEFSRIDLLDNTGEMLDRVSEKLEEGGLYHLNPVHEAFENFNPINGYDIIYSAMFLHHIIDTDFILKHLYDVTNAEGKVFLCDLYSEDGRFHPDTIEGIYHHGFDPDLLANKMKNLGFVINNIQTVYNFDRNDRLYPMFVIEATKR